jgi:hypothetical protein
MLELLIRRPGRPHGAIGHAGVRVRTTFGLVEENVRERALRSTQMLLGR